MHKFNSLRWEQFKRQFYETIKLFLLMSFVIYFDFTSPNNINVFLEG